MIRPYKFIVTPHHQLYDNILLFFNKIKVEKGEYSADFFDKIFYNNIVSHHKILLEEPLKKVFEIFKTWNDEDRVNFYNRIVESNDIENICNRSVIPLTSKTLPDDLKALIHDVFVDLYEKILKGKNVESLESHFKSFKAEPNDFIKCPACGLNNTKSKEEKRDQYDHYLSKDIYPLSSINFKNLVPICAECNSIMVKGTFDVLSGNGNRKIFYPYDETYTMIDISGKLINDDGDINNLDFDFEYTTKDGDKTEEILSWKKIYKIDERHKKRSKGLARKWYNRYWEFLNDPTYSSVDLSTKKSMYYNYFIEDEDIEVIKKPVIEALENSKVTKAKIESSLYQMKFD